LWHSQYPPFLRLLLGYSIFANIGYWKWGASIAFNDQTSFLRPNTWTLSIETTFSFCFSSHLLLLDEIDIPCLVFLFLSLELRYSPSASLIFDFEFKKRIEHDGGLIPIGTSQDEESLVTNTALRDKNPVWFVPETPLDPRFEDHPFLVGIAKRTKEAGRTAMDSCIVEFFDKYVVVG
jgi:hypothetical protein